MKKTNIVKCTCEWDKGLKEIAIPNCSCPVHGKNNTKIYKKLMKKCK